MADSFVAAVRRTLLRFDMVHAGDRVLVALSGGADSVALLGVLAELAPVLACELQAAHVNHALRGAASDADERVAAAAAAGLRVPYVAERLEPGALQGVDGGVEQAARAARYALLRRIAAERRCAVIATGHTLDDQAETVLLRLLRGSHVAGLRGIEPVRGDGIVRPLIAVRRAEIIAYLQRRGLAWTEDASNADPRFTRNRVRLEVVPLLTTFNPRVVEQLGRLALRFGAEGAGEDALAREIVRRDMDAAGGLPIGRYDRLPIAARCTLVRVWLREVRGDLRRIQAAHVETLAQGLPGGGCLSLPQAVIANEHGVLRILPQTAAQEPPVTAIEPGGSVRFGRRWEIAASALETAVAISALPRSGMEAVFDADCLTLPLRVRPWRRGDRVQPVGMSGHRKLSDLFIDRKVPRSLRAATPVVESDGAIVWVPGVVRGARALVTAATTRVVRLSARRVGGGG